MIDTLSISCKQKNTHLKFLNKVEYINFKNLFTIAFVFIMSTTKHPT